MSYVFKYWKAVFIFLGLSVMLILAYQKGVYDENQIWVIKDLERTSEAITHAFLVSEAARKKEQKYSQDLARIDQEGFNQIRKIKNETAHTIATLKRDNVRLSVSIKNNSNRACSEGINTSLDNGEARAELSDEAFEFLAREAERADRVVVQLMACQKVMALAP